MHDIKKNSFSERSGTVSLGPALRKVINSLQEDEFDLNKIYRASKVKNLFQKSIEDIYKENAVLILKSINAVYIMDDIPKYIKDPKQFDIQKKLVIYICDSTVYADLDSRQELIKIWFYNHGEKIDFVELLSSKLKMRNTFPYKEYVENYFSKFQEKQRQYAEKNKDPVLSNPLKLNILKNQIYSIKNSKVRNSLNKLIDAIKSV